MSFQNFNFAGYTFIMKTSVEISYYPLDQEFIPPIKDFIERINKYDGLIAKTNGMSTQVFGDYDLVMEALTHEIKQSFRNPHSVFVMKVINADLNTRETK
jgi:uncharacterized protein YqgV (UPF0045/DUF77 family)